MQSVTDENLNALHLLLNKTPAADTLQLAFHSAWSLERLVRSTYLEVILSAQSKARQVNVDALLVAAV